MIQTNPQNQPNSEPAAQPVEESMEEMENIEVRPLGFDSPCPPGESETTSFFKTSPAGSAGPSVKFGEAPINPQPSFISADNPRHAGAFTKLESIISPLKKASRRKGVGTFIGIVLLLAFLGTGGVVAVTNPQIRTPLSNELRYWWYQFFQTMTPQEVLQKMAARTSEIQTAQTRASWYWRKPEEKDYQTSIIMDGFFDARTSDNLKLNYTVNIYQNQSDLLLAAGLKYLDKKIYFNFTNLPENFLLDFSAITDRWFFVDATGARALRDIVAPPGENAVIGGIPSTGADHFKQLITKYQLYQFDKILPDGLIDERPVYHYRFLLHKQNLIALLNDFELIVKEESKRRGIRFNYPSESQVKLIQALNKVDVLAELWIDKRDYSLRKGQVYAYTAGSVAAAKEPNAWANLAQLAQAQENGSAETREPIFTVLVTIDRINAPMTIQEPEKSESFAQVMKQIFEPWFRQLPILQPPVAPATPTAYLPAATNPSMELPASDSDQDDLSDAMELYFGTDPLKPDTDGDSFSDGQEVQNGFNPLGEGELE